MDNEGDAGIPDFDKVSDLSPASEEVRTTENDDTDVSVIGTDNTEVEVTHTTPDKVDVSEEAENLAGRGTTSVGGATAEANVSRVASNRLLVPIVAEKECRVKENNDPPIVDTELDGDVAGATTPSEPAVSEEGAKTEPAIADKGDKTPLGWTHVMADPTLGDGGISFVFHRRLIIEVGDGGIFFVFHRRVIIEVEDAGISFVIQDLLPLGLDVHRLLPFP